MLKPHLSNILHPLTICDSFCREFQALFIASIPVSICVELSEKWLLEVDGFAAVLHDLVTGGVLSLGVKLGQIGNGCHQE